MHEIDRILGILLVLQSRRAASARQLAARFEVSTRTIYRDVRTMSLLGIPLYSERGRNGGIRLLEGYFLPPLMFSREEAIALLLALTLLRSLRVVPFRAATETAAQKLLAAVPGHLRAMLAHLERLIGVERPQSDIFHPEPDQALRTDADAQRESGVVTRFVEALLEGREVHLSYQSPYRDAVSGVVARPLGLFWDRDRWYLAGAEAGAASSTASATSLWRADRAAHLSIAVTRAGLENSQGEGRNGQDAADFDIGALLGHAWLKRAMASWRRNAPVSLRITAEQARRLRQDWYYRFAEYENDDGDDGGVLMTFGESDPEVVLALVRWLGPGAELIAPEAWRALLRTQLEAMLRHT